ncbi:hypothetical protein ANSO36C_02400 [Nostoc cf. commune SO-36]|uniref:Uncharacterized protein n=1 Tax=Nostoc cf. commune SO-36 TaxID=449208 RepID=A0ABN6PTS3_NOSCO|nr:hypothetical protein [Nostoc commune]BDI14438.1 hypothetical protein ANSO36C_02400 [Nostoc cf. commune SO-36]
MVSRQITNILEGITNTLWQAALRFNKRAERRLAAQYAVTCVLAEATTLADAVIAILKS